MSKRIHQTAAEKQKAYRDRLRANGPILPAPKPAKPKRQSRPKRLEALETAVRALTDEYQQWLDGIPENLAGGTLADDLRETIRQLEAVADNLGVIDPPKGFGR